MASARSGRVLIVGGAAGTALPAGFARRRDRVPPHRLVILADLWLDRLAAGGHPMAGARLLRGHITRADGSVSRMYELFHDGRFVLLHAACPAPGGLPGCVRAVRYARCTVRLPPPLLVRPDGYVAWAPRQRDPVLRAAEAHSAVQRWCSPG